MRIAGNEYSLRETAGAFGDLGTLIPFFGGLELAAGVQAGSLSKADRYVMAFTAGTALWNMGAAYVGGLALWYGLRRRWLRL